MNGNWISTDVTPDKMGRVQLTVALRNVAGLKQEITFLGVGDHIEIWDTDMFKKKNNKSNYYFIGKK